MRVSDHNPSVPAFGHRPIEELEQALGLSFQDRGLLRQALTHRSWVGEHSGNAADSYQRLEFLGDVIIRLIVSDELYRRLPECDEGGLSRRCSAIWDQRTLASVASGLGLTEYIRLGRGSDSHGHRYTVGLLGDVMESVIGAVYLDRGYAYARKFVLKILASLIDSVCRPDWRLRNPKGELQELLQSMGQSPPTYRVVDTSGSPHQPRYTVEVVGNAGVLAAGTGRSKNAAETKAAEAALATLAR